MLTHRQTLGFSRRFVIFYSITCSIYNKYNYYILKSADAHRSLFPGKHLRAHQSSILKMDGWFKQSPISHVHFIIHLSQLLRCGDTTMNLKPPTPL